LADAHEIHPRVHNADQSLARPGKFEASSILHTKDFGTAKLLDFNCFHGRFLNSEGVAVRLKQKQQFALVSRDGLTPKVRDFRELVYTAN
jgi:hypothetical protein